MTWEDTVASHRTAPTSLRHHVRPGLVIGTRGQCGSLLERAFDVVPSGRTPVDRLQWGPWLAQLGLAGISARRIVYEWCGCTPLVGSLGLGNAGWGKPLVAKVVRAEEPRVLR